MRLISLAILLGVSYAHICMWMPPQRGAMSIADPGDSSCYQKVGPCGSVPSNPAFYTVLYAGEQFTVRFQQNYNHYYVGNAGDLNAQISFSPNPTEKDFVYQFGKNITDYNAMNMITQTNLTFVDTVPNTLCENCVLRVRYVSNNPDENDRSEIFYQCADIKIRAKPPAPSEHANEAKKEIVLAAPTTPLSSSSSSSSLPRIVRESTTSHADVNADANPDCCFAGSTFAMQGRNTNSWRQDTAIAIWMDKAAGLMRVDTNSGSGKTIYDGYFQMYINFTTTPEFGFNMEYYYNVATGECEPTGADFWNDWCYGATESETYMGTEIVGGRVANVWQNGDFLFQADAKTCAPMALWRTSTGEVTVYSNVTVGTPDPSVFIPPAACQYQPGKTQTSPLSASASAAKRLLHSLRPIRR